MRANRCLSEVLRPSPPNVKPEIHKGAASEPLCAPSAQDNVGLHSQTINKTNVS